MQNPSWKQTIRAYDDRRDIVIPGDNISTIAWAVNQFIEIAQESIEDHGFFSVALSGGSTPIAIYKQLSAPFYKEQVDWTRVLFFWSDERCVPPDDPESNYTAAMKAGLGALPIPQENIFRLQGEIEPEKSAKNYEELIREHIPNQTFDLVMLGMGEDGHTASLFPKTHGLHASDGLVISNFVPQKNTWRLSLTFNAINEAHYIAIYILGKSKSSMVSKVLTSKFQPDELPIQKIGTPSHKALWVLDNEAARELKN